MSDNNWETQPRKENGEFASRFLKGENLLSKKFAEIAKKMREKTLIKELEKNQIKFSINDLVFITKCKTGKIVWLEKGSEKAGLAHIEKAHGDDFLKKGISKDKIPDLLLEVVNNGIDTGKKQGRHKNARPIYDVEFEGKKLKVAITISENGFLVGANPCSDN